LLEGIRGHPPLDREKLIETLLSVSKILVDNPRISEFDINPLIVLEDGVIAVDARTALSYEPLGED
jgi:acetyltransferase